MIYDLRKFFDWLEAEQLAVTNGLVEKPASDMNEYLKRVGRYTALRDAERKLKELINGVQDGDSKEE